MRQYIGAPYKDAAFLRAAQTQHFTEALGKHRSKHAQDKIFRHEQNVIHENGMPKPVHMHIKFPDDRKIRNADQVVRQKAGDSRNERPPKGECILSSHHARRERRRNEPYNVPEGELQYIGKTASARKHRQPQKPHEYIHRHGNCAPFGAEQKPGQHRNDRLKCERYIRYGDAYKGGYDHQHDEQSTFRKPNGKRPVPRFCQIFIVYV